MGKAYAVMKLGQLKQYKTIEAAVNNHAHYEKPVEIFEITVTSIGWYKPKREIEKVEAPPQPAKNEDDEDGEDFES
jgi:hypothetical protein